MIQKTAPTKNRWLKITLFVLGFLFFIIISTIVWLQTSSGKRFVLNKAVSFLQSKLGKGIQIGKLDYSFPNWIALDDVLILDQQNDTLLSGKTIRVELNMFALINGSISINKAHLININATINRHEKDSLFNFQYIIDAFASKTVDTTKNKKPIDLSLHQLLIDNLRFRYKDSIHQLFCTADIDQLNTGFNKIDLATLNIETNQFLLSNSTIKVLDKSSKQPQTTTVSSSQSPLKLQLSNLGLYHLNLSYTSVSDSLNYHNNIDSLQLLQAHLVLANRTLTAKAINIHQSSFSLTTNHIKTVTKDTAITSVSVPTKGGWDIKIDAIHLRDDNVAVHNNDFMVIKDGLDQNHLVLNNISLQVNAIHYNTDTIYAKILSGNVNFNQLLVKNISGNVFLNNQKASIDCLVLLTQNSYVKGTALMVFNDKNQSKQINESSAVSLVLNKSYVGNQDLIFFIPSYKRQTVFNPKSNQRIWINTNLNGDFKKLHLSLFDLKTDDGRLVLNMQGILEHTLDISYLKYNTIINKLYVDKTLLSDKMLAQLAQQKINLPANILLNVTASGTSSKEVNTHLSMISPFGKAIILAKVKNLTNLKNAQYNLDIKANNLQTGKWIYKDSLLGLFTGNLKLIGNGTNYKVSDIKTTAIINSFVLNGYPYTNAHINASLEKGLFVVKGSIQDTNLISTIDLNGSLINKYPTAKGTIDIAKADLRKLSISKDSMIIRSAVLIDIQDLSPSKLNMAIRLDSNVLSFQHKTLFADSILIKANAENDTTKLLVAAPFLQLNMTGKYDYVQLPKALQHFLHQYQNGGIDTANIANQQMVLHATITQDSIMKQILPSLTMEQPAVVFVSFNNSLKDTALLAKVTVPNVLYNSMVINDLKIDANGQDSTLNVHITNSEMTLGGKKYYNTKIDGRYVDSTISIAAQTNDGKNKQFYAISSVIALLKEETRLHLSDTLILNHERWNVTKNNLVVIKKEGYIFSNFIIQKDKETISINNKEATVTSPIIIKIDNFNIGDALAISDKDSTMASGILNVNATLLQPITSMPILSGTIDINQLAIKKAIIGDVHLTTEIGIENKVSVKGAISGANSLSVDGGYDMNNESFAISTQVQKLSMKAVEALSAGQIIRANGNIHGDIYANGTLSEPRWKGELIFDTTTLSTAMFGSQYNISNQKIDFDYPNIGLYDFTIKDSLGKSLIIDGTIQSQNNSDFALNLTAKSKDFIAVNQPRTSNSNMYGLAIIDADMEITGTTSVPDISGNLKLENNSDVHYILAPKNNYKDDLKQVVKFVNIDTIPSFPKRNTLFSSLSDSASTIIYSGIKYNLNLEVKDKANVTVIVDPSTGDELNIKGSAQLNAGVDENGILGLTGVYQLKEGSYNLSYQFIKKKFNLQEGSTITFSGNPTEAIEDITAVYEVETSPKELLGNEITDNSTALGSAYNKKIPFDVVLKIKGAITKPEFSFDIKIKDNADGVNTTLGTTIDNKLIQYRNDASEMNKQVFALLIMGRFIGDKSSDFFASNNSGSTANDIVKESVSKFLAEAVNHIAADLIKGVDINLDLKNYEADALTNTATRTDLNIELSKQLLDDRLTVTVGKSVTVDGSDPIAKTQTNSNLDFLPDITTTYKLSKDGRYAIKAYRKNQYEAIMDGYFIETGMAFTLTVNYEKLKELFSKKNHKK